MNLPDPTGKTVLILTGEFAGEEGVCLGRTASGKRWAISPNCSNKIIELKYDQEFGIVLNPGQDSHRN